MYDKLDEIVERYNKLNDLLSDPEVIKDQDQYRKLSKEHSDKREIVDVYLKLKSLAADISGAEELLTSGDKEMKDMAEQEILDLKVEVTKYEDDLRMLLLPKDPFDDKNIYLEIRAGTGGDEASLFAADLYRMYTRYAELKRYKVEIIEMSETGLGGYNFPYTTLFRSGAFSRLKFEAGGHRVQRIPDTESSGRVHTSACTVAVLPEADDIDVAIEQKDLRIDVYRAGGAGGQHVNTTDSAVRITHIPTNIVVTCQDERSQIKNKEKAMKHLRSKILEEEMSRAAKEQADSRKLQVGSGDRSERIRTYNFPQNRLTDHRINLTIYSLDRVMEGILDEVLDLLANFHQAERLKTAGL